MKPDELFALITAALVDLDINQETEQGKRIYLAYLASRVGQGLNGPLERRLTELRKDLGI